MIPGTLISTLVRTIKSIITRRWIRSNNAGNNTNRVTYGGDRAVAVGLLGMISYSTDGFTYTAVETSAISSAALNDVIFDGSRWLAVGVSGTLLVSSDSTATSWSKINTGFNALSFNSIAYDGTTYVICNSTGTTVTTSTDLIAFTSMSVTGSTTGKSRIIYGGGQFVMVGNSQVCRSATGTTWVTVSPGVTLIDVAYNGSTYVACSGGANNSIYSSSDGISWNVRATPAYGQFSVVWSAGIGKFVVTTNAGVYTSPDGITWLNVYPTGNYITPGMLTSAPTGVWAVSNIVRSAPSTTMNGSSWVTSYSKAAPASSFMYTYASYTAQSSNGATQIPISTAFPAGGALMAIGPHAVVSTDGDKWLHGSGVVISSVANTYPIVGATPRCLIAGTATATSAFAVSTDLGVSWVSRTSGLGNVAFAGACGNDTVSCAYSPGGIISSSTDSATWTSAGASGVASIVKIVWNGTYFVAIGSGLTTRSTLGSSGWSTTGATTVGISTPRHAVWTGAAIIACGATGASGVIKRSTDHGATWSLPTTSPVGMSTLGSIAHDPITNTTIMIGNLSNTVYRSTDHGVNWATITMNRFMPTMNNVIWVGSKFIITCTQGRIISSVDGLTWDGGPSLTFVPDQPGLKVSTVKKLNGVYWSAGTSISAVMTTSSLDLPWEHSTTGAGYFVQQIIYAQGRYVLGASNNVQSCVLMTSPTLTTIPTVAHGGNSFGSITLTSYASGQYVSGLVYDGTNYVLSITAPSTDGWIFTSPDAVTWTVRTATSPTGFVVLTNGILFAGRLSGLYTSIDSGVTWTLRANVGVMFRNGNVAYNGSIYVAVGDGRVLTSPDAITWSVRTFSGSSGAQTVFYDGEVFIIGSGPNATQFSADGTTWTSFPWLSASGNYDMFQDGANVMTVSSLGAVSKLSST